MTRPRPQRARDPAKEAAFEALYRRELAFVWRMLRAHGVPETRVEDAAQDVFMVVYRRWDDWRADSRARSPRSWLFGIARRVAAGHRRRHARELRDAELAVPRAPELPADERASRREALASLQRAIASLDDKSRAVFVLAELEGMTGREIAAVLGAKPNTVYWRLRVARARIAELMADSGEPRGERSRG
jgi:RNA polymerase sigma factor (sigma-70 family)